MNSCSTNYSKPLICFDHENSSVLDVLHTTVPNCQSGHWQPLTTEWKGLFYTHVVLFGSLFLLLAIWCLICLCNHQTLMRLRRTKTFLAVDVALMILGFSRVIFFVLDPYGISGYCDAFACIVVSRVLSALAFPSLTASYTLVFFTLWHVSTVTLGRSKVQRWNIIVPLCFVHYFFAVTVELICVFSAYSAIFLLLVCEFAFTVGGLVVCLTFMVVGFRILKSVKATARESSIIRRDATLTRLNQPMQEKNLSLSRINTNAVDSNSNGLVNNTIVGAQPGLSESSTDQSIKHSVSPRPEMLSTTNNTILPSVHGKRRFFFAPRSSKLEQFMLKHHQQAIRKVTFITYTVAVLGGLYSLVGLAHLILLVIMLFAPCPKDESPMGNNPYVWLILKYVSSLMEFLLGCLLVYSVNEIRPVLRMFHTAACSILRCRKVFQTYDVTASEDSKHCHSFNQTSGHCSIVQKQGELQMWSEAPVKVALPIKKCKQSAEVSSTADMDDIKKPTENHMDNHCVV